MAQTFTTDDVSKNPSEFFIDDFLMVGPDIAEFKRLRTQDNKRSDTLTVKPSVIYNIDGKPTKDTYT